MIAQIEPAFSGDSLGRKIDYQLDKIDKGVAKELYNSVGEVLSNMEHNMSLLASMNDRVKKPYIEITLNLRPGEAVSDEKFISMAQDYMYEMGYENSLYSVILNTDKEHTHVHILATTVDFDGVKISDNLNYSRSKKIVENLEKKYGLKQTEQSKAGNRRRLFGELKHREYFFDTALHKALRNNNIKGRMNDILEESDMLKSLKPDLSKHYTNDEWATMLGAGIFEKVFSVLEDGNFFKPLLKAELLGVLDETYLKTKDINDFRKQLEKKGFYMRLVTKGEKSYYVYGMPEQNFYLKDTSLPQKYRYGNMPFNGKGMSVDEQKHYLYDQVFLTLNKSSNYQDFRDNLIDKGVKVIEHSNAKGIYGLSFMVNSIEDPHIFKSSDISRKLTYKNIQVHYMQQEQESEIDSTLHRYASDRQSYENNVSYMLPAAVFPLGGITGGRERSAKEDEYVKKKKKKNKNKDLSL